MNRKQQNYVRSAILVLAICFIIIGAMRGETTEVLQKAINICLQCIGIG